MYLWIISVSQAVHCSLHGIKPTSGDWNIPPEKLQQHIKLSIKYISACHNVIETKHGKTYSIQLVSEDGVDVADTLVSQGLAGSTESVASIHSSPQPRKMYVHLVMAVNACVLFNTPRICSIRIGHVHLTVIFWWQRKCIDKIMKLWPRENNRLYSIWFIVTKAIPVLHSLMDWSIRKQISAILFWWKKN